MLELLDLLLSLLLLLLVGKLLSCELLLCEGAPKGWLLRLLGDLCEPPLAGQGQLHLHTLGLVGFGGGLTGWWGCCGSCCSEVLLLLLLLLLLLQTLLTLVALLLLPCDPSLGSVLCRFNGCLAGEGLLLDAALGVRDAAAGAVRAVGGLRGSRSEVNTSRTRQGAHRLHC